MTHKERCKQLKEMRKEMADKIGLDLHQTECTYAGECSGTCAKCQQEERKLNKALLSGAIALAGVALTACSAPGSDVQVAERGHSRSESGSNRESSRSSRENDDKPYFWENIIGSGNSGDDVEVLGGDVEYDPDLYATTGVAAPVDVDDDVLAGDVVLAEPISDETIIEACEHYSGAPIVEIDYYDGDYVNVHCYEEITEADGTVRNSTWDYIVVDSYSGAATDITGNIFYINDYLEDE